MMVCPLMVVEEPGRRVALEEMMRAGIEGVADEGLMTERPADWREGMVAMALGSKARGMVEASITMTGWLGDELEMEPEPELEPTFDPAFDPASDADPVPDPEPPELEPDPEPDPEPGELGASVGTEMVWPPITVAGPPAVRVMDPPTTTAGCAGVGLEVAPGVSNVLSGVSSVRSGVATIGMRVLGSATGLGVVVVAGGLG